MLDAPVSGSVPQVQSGTLTIMVGGDEEAYARVEPALQVLGTPTRVGVNGQGLALKLAINISLAVQMLAFSEGLLLAARDGVDPKVASDVMTQSAIGSPMLKLRAPLILDLPQEAWFDVGLLRKDIRLALAMAQDLGLGLPSAGAAVEVLEKAVELGYERRDIAALYEVLAQTNGGRPEGMSGSCVPMTRGAWSHRRPKTPIAPCRRFAPDEPVGRLAARRLGRTRDRRVDSPRNRPSGALGNRQ